MKRPFAVIGLTMFFTVALLFEFETGVTVTALAVFTVALVISLFISSVRKHGFLPAVFSSGAIACVLLICAVNFTYLPVMSLDGANNCEIKARVTGTPEIRYGNYYYETEVYSVDSKDADFRLRMVFSTPPEAEPYDIIEGRFNLYALGASESDFLESYKAKGVFLGGYPVSGDVDVIAVPEDEKPFGFRIVKFREALKNSVFRILPDDRGALAVALITGDTGFLSDEVYSDLRTVGISHIICVSGFHLSLWSFLVLEIIRKTRVKYWVGDILAGICVVMFMLVAGLTYSVVRAGIMMLVFLLGDILMKRRDSLNSLGFALAVTAVSNPFAMGSVSLQLSALATLGIILYVHHIAPDIKRILSRIGKEKPRRILMGIISPLMVTVSATAFTLPVSLPLYGSVNYISFIANLILVPVAGFTMIVSASAAFLCSVSQHIFGMLSVCAGKLLEFIIEFSHFLAKTDLLTFRFDSDQILIIFTGIFVLCLATVFISQLSKPVYSLASLMCAVIFTVFAVFVSHSESKQTKILVTDCGNGISVLIQNNGDTVLIGSEGDDFLGAQNITENIYENRNRLDCAVFADEADNPYLHDIFKQYKPERIYCDSLPEGVDLLLSGCENSSFSSLEGTENIALEGAFIGDNYCVLAETDDLSALICFTPSFDYSDLPENFRDTDVIVSRSNFPEGSEENGALMVLTADEKRADRVLNLLYEKGVSSVSTANGDVVIRAQDGIVSAAKK